MIGDAEPQFKEPAARGPQQCKSQQPKPKGNIEMERWPNSYLEEGTGATSVPRNTSFFTSRSLTARSKCHVREASASPPGEDS